MLYIKGKLIGLGFLLPVCGLGGIFLSSIFILMRSKTWEGVHQLALSLCMDRLANDKEALKMAIAMAVIIFAIAAMLVFMMGDNKTIYKSELRVITDKISTPIPYGEKQHGSAAWMSKSDYSKSFGEAILDTKKGIFAELISQGYDDLEFMKPKKEDVNLNENSKPIEKNKKERR